MRYAIKSLLLLVLFAPVVLARQGTVRTTGDLTYEGEIIERPDDVTIISHGIKTTVPRDQILAITWAGDAKANIEDQLKKLQPNDVAGRMTLAKKAFDNHEYLLARQILRDVLEIDPNNREANDFYEMIRGQIELDRRKAAAATRPVTTVPATGVAETGSTFRPHYVSQEDINNIRAMEVTNRDTNLRIRFDNDVLRRFALATNQDYTQFRMLPALQQFLAIRAAGNYEMLKDVKILSDPVSILEYRRSVQPIILAGCATAGCHGTPGKGDFQLYNAPEDPATYTNFYILSTYTKVIPASPLSNAPGAPRAMIDRNLPGQSLVLEYGLPPAISDADHPPVRGQEYRGFFHGRNDPRYLTVLNWITNTLLQVTPRYDVSYKPAFLHEATSAPTIGSHGPETPYSEHQIKEQSQQPVGQPGVTNPNAANPR